MVKSNLSQWELNVNFERFTRILPLELAEKEKGPPLSEMLLRL